MSIRLATLPRALGLVALLLLAACAGRDSDSELLAIRTAEDTRDASNPRLVDDLEGGTKPVRAAAARALGRIGDPGALEPLTRALGREDAPEVRREIAFALGILGEPGAVPDLLAALDREEDATTSAELAIALGRIGDPGALDALHRLLGSSWGLIQERAIEALALIADPASVPGLIEAMDDPDPGVAWRAAYALEKIEGTTQVPALIDACGASDEMLRRAAVRSLGRLGAKEGIAAIVAARESNPGDWQLHCRVADALGRIGEEDADALRVVEALLRSPNFHVRVAALQAVGRAGWRSLLPQVLDLRSDPVVDVRAAAYEATADCLDGRTKEVLWPGLADASPLVVETCLRRLGEATDPEIVPALLDSLDLSANRIHRLGAAQGLGAAGDRAGLARVVALLKDRDPFVATTAATALGEREDPAAASGLVEAMARSGPAWADLRLAAATALGKVGDDRAAAVLREAMVEDSDPRIRLAARDALEEILPPGEAVDLPTPDDIRGDVRTAWRSALQPPIVARSSATQLILHTDRGRIVIDLFGADAPQMVESFATLAENGFFRDLTFHRVVGDFVIQGGDPTGTGWGDAGYTLRSEWNPRRYERGTVGIAHSGKDTGSCQLFITQAPQPHLDARYTIWGEVVTGMDVVDRIQRGDRFRAEVVRAAD